MFHDFRLDFADLGDVRLRFRHGGRGDPVVLLHGHPRTHTTWHAVAPRLAGRLTVVAPDLRGYGGSTLPPDRPGHTQSAKREMARDVVRLMRLLGHERFAVVGHDRGALVAFRTAMDHPDAWYRTPGPEAMGAGNHADVWASLRDPAVVHGMCEDYRAGLGVDREHDEADRAAGRRVVCPVMLLESEHDDLDVHGDPARIWAPWLARPLRHRLIDSGHHQAEEAPGPVAEALLEFLEVTGERTVVV